MPAKALPSCLDQLRHARSLRTQKSYQACTGLIMPLVGTYKMSFAASHIRRLSIQMRFGGTSISLFSGFPGSVR
jgi:hypothetical protein